MSAAQSQKVLVRFQASLILTALALSPGAGDSLPILLLIVASGVLVLVLGHRRTASPPDLRRSLVVAVGSVWSAAVFGPLALEALGLLGRPGPLGILALALTWLVWVLVVLALWTCALGSLRWRRRLRVPMRAATLGSSLVLTLFLLEVLFRGHYPRTPYEVRPLAADGPRQMYRRDATLGFTMVPGFRGQTIHPQFPGTVVRINESGFRDRSWPNTPPREKKRVLCLGDSFVFGLGVEEDQAFPRKLESFLSERMPAVTFNAGVPGYSPSQEVVVLRRLVGRLDPDLVLMVIFTGNDLTGELSNVRRLARNRLGKDLEGKVTRLLGVSSLPGGTDDDDLEDSVAVQLPDADPGRRRHVADVVGTALRPAYWNKTSRLYGVGYPRLMSMAVRVGFADRDIYGNHTLVQATREEPGPEVLRAIELSASATASAHRICEKRRAKFLVVLAPDQLLVDPDMFERYFSSRKVSQRVEHDADVLHRRLTSRLRGLGIQVLDLQPALRRARQQGRDLYYLEGHWNTEGHRFVAESITRFLIEEGLLEA